ncbi:ribose transport system substrate-binding protein [Mesorhizobium albiziae]|uniref:Ribose transport system substrate-binding protein n=2 Tax=Neomesorhizobium albiziae TaxID=335020 RepID=A0A1I4AK36_9HYPH|nr:sugar ABC transporter substrate-binding protein [Mesorhizobium albiziae]SFK56301.1 ribose transport system substrate-binding protein [Mesorhizobium albiziae]
MDLRKWTLAVAAGVSMLASAAHAQESKFRCSEGETYYMNVMVSGVEYWFPVYEAFKQAAQSMGCKTAYTGTPEYDVNKQIASFDQVLAKQPAGILVHPMNSDPFIEPINRAVDSGVAVVTFAADSPNSKRASYVTSDNNREGSYAADVIAEAMGGKGEYGILENPGQDNHDKRVAAFVARMTEKYPDIKLVGRAATNQDANKAYQAVMSMAQANPNLGALFMPEANSALGAAQAAQELGGKIRVMNADVNGKILDMIKAGQVFGAVNPNQGIQGYMGFMLLFMAKHPELIDPMNDWKRAGYNPMGVPFVDNGFAVVTKDNADDFYWDAYLKRRGTKGIEE